MHQPVMTRTIASLQTIVGRYRRPAAAGISRAGRNHRHTRRVLISSVAVLATVIATLGGMVATSSPAYAALPPDTFALVNPNTAAGGGNMCLDDSAVYGVRAYPCNGPSQLNGYQAWRWWIGPDGAPHAVLQNVATGWCLDDSPQGLSDYGCSWSRMLSGYQAWVPSWSSSPFQLANSWSGGCLDYSKQNGLRPFGCNDSSYYNGYQAWSQVWLS